MACGDRAGDALLRHNDFAVRRIEFNGNPGELEIPKSCQ